MAEGDNNKNKRPLGVKMQLKILAQDGSLVRVEIKRHIPLKKLLLKYCETKNLEYGAVRFIYDGSRVPVSKTPEELQMEDGDIIDAMVAFNGGGYDMGI